MEIFCRREHKGPLDGLFLSPEAGGLQRAKSPSKTIVKRPTTRCTHIPSIAAAGQRLLGAGSHSSGRDTSSYSGETPTSSRMNSTQANISDIHGTPTAGSEDRGGHAYRPRQKNTMFQSCPHFLPLLVSVDEINESSESAEPYASPKIVHLLTQIVTTTWQALT